jgi:hypothetical protein
VNPQSVEQYRQFPGYGHHGSSFCIFPALGRNPKPKIAQLTIRAERSENVLRTVDEQAPNNDIPSFGDRQLLIGLPGLVSAWNQSEKRTYIPTFLESFRVFER